MLQSIFDLQAGLCHSMSNATRLRIVHALRDGPQCVTHLAQVLDLDQAKVSQNLSVLRSRGIVASQRQGGEVIYRITDPQIERICDLMREFLAEQAEKRSELAAAIRVRRRLSMGPRRGRLTALGWDARVTVIWSSIGATSLIRVIACGQIEASAGLIEPSGIAHSGRKI